MRARKAKLIILSECLADENDDRPGTCLHWAGRCGAEIPRWALNDLAPDLEPKQPRLHGATDSKLQWAQDQPWENAAGSPASLLATTQCWAGWMVLGFKDSRQPEPNLQHR